MILINKLKRKWETVVQLRQRMKNAKNLTTERSKPQQLESFHKPILMKLKVPLSSFKSTGKVSLLAEQSRSNTASSLVA